MIIIHQYFGNVNSVSQKVPGCWQMINFLLPAGGRFLSTSSLGQEWVTLPQAR